MRTVRSAGGWRGYVFCLAFLFLASAALFGEDANPGDTPPLPYTTSLYTWEDVGALFCLPDPSSGKLNADLLHDEAGTWYTHYYSAYAAAPVGGSAFHAPAVMAAGRIGEMAKDWWVSAGYTADATGNKVSVLLQNGASVLLDAGNGLLAPRRYGDLAVVAADVDAVVEDDDSFHQEIVVLYDYIQDGVETLRVSVVDHNLNILATMEVADPALQFRDGPGAALAAADVDADGKREIVVAYNALYQGYFSPAVVACRYADGALLAGSPLLYQSVSFRACELSLAAGDFNGDVLEEVFVGGLSYPYNDNTAQTSGYVFGASFDLALTPTRRNAMFLYVPTGAPPYNPHLPSDQVRVSVAAGWFKAPATAEPATRRQLAAALVGPDLDMSGMFLAGTKIYTYVYGFNLDWTESMASWSSFNASTANFQAPLLDLKLLPGNFLGSGNTTPNMDLGFFFVQSDRSVHFDACKVDSGNFSIANPYFRTGSLGTLADAFPALGVAKMDANGGSVILGPPVHLVLQDVLTPDYTIEEPPKHMDWLPEDPSDPNSAWTLFNLSRATEFTCAYTKSGETSQAHTGKNTAEGGAGLSATLGASFKEKFNVLLFKAKLEGDLQATINFSFQRAIDRMDSTGQSYDYSLEHSAENDDILQYRTRCIDIWRYPIYGYTALNPNSNQTAQGYYDVNYPPRDTGTNIVSGLGCSDFYQPVHQNANVLSYPDPADHPYTNDLGSFTLPGSSEPLSVFLNDTNASFGVDGSAKTLEVKYTTTAGSETTKSWTENLSGDIDFKLSLMIKELYFNKQTFNFNASLQADGSWSQLDTDAKEASSTKGLTIEVPSFPGMNSSMIYKFTPYVYFSKSGNSKVQHATTIPTSSAWWTHQYAQKPDPGLNLPNHFKTLYNEHTGKWEEWDVDESLYGQRMRGLLLQTAEVCPATGQPMDVNSEVTDGTRLTVTARVYNFSLLACATPFDVRFECVPVDFGDNETGPRVLIGTATVTSMNPREMKEVSVTWDTTGLGPGVAGSSSAYRIWVTVDPDEKVTAIHPHGSKCDNKEGYWPWNGGVSILSAVPAARQVRAAGFAPKIRLGIRKADGALQTGWGATRLGTWNKLGVLVTADTSDSRNLHVVFYDWLFFSREPQQTLAYRILRGLSWDLREQLHVAHANIDWRPTEPGLHFLRAKFANSSLPQPSTALLSVDTGANLFVWVPFPDAQENLARLDGTYDQVEAQKSRLVELIGEPLVQRLRQKLLATRETAQTRLLLGLPLVEAEF